MEGTFTAKIAYILTAIFYLIWSIGTTDNVKITVSRFRAFSQPFQSRTFETGGPGFNMTTCLWVHFDRYGRSGNKVRQIMDVKELLSRCSGVASSDSASNSGDPVLAFPPVLFAVASDCLDHPSTLLSLAARECEEVSYKWGHIESLARKCSSIPVYDISVPVDRKGSSSPVLLANVYADRTFWKHQITTLDTMVMYFRGGDILRENAHPGYSQGPCSLFLESWYAANVSRAVLVYDPNTAIHPCVAFVREAIGNGNIVPTPCDSAGCHMMLVGRARYVVVSGVTTFATAAFELFLDRRRIIFRYFCHERVPHETQIGLEICVKGGSEGLVPWSYTNETRRIMMHLPSQVVLNNMSMSSFRQYLKKGDDDHMTSRRMRLRS